MHRSTKTPECLPEEGFYDNEYTLFNSLPCKSECISCISYNVCTACKTELNRILNTKNGHCEC